MNKAGLILCMMICFIFNLQLSAQQDPMFSQYMFNKLIINPGYAGSTGTFNASLSYRRQFIGLEGAPQIQAITIDAPFKAKPMGFGIKAIHERIGATSQNEVTAIYAYHLNLAKGMLSLGVEGGIFNQAIDFTNLRRTIQDDNAIPTGKESAVVPDAAFGLYYASEKLYLGGAFYHLLQNELNYSGYTGNDRTLIAKLSSHSYMIGGFSFKPQDNVEIEPSFLLKYVASAPLQIDMNVNTTFKNVFTIGATYRNKSAIVFLFQFSFKERLRFGYAYDYIIGELSSYGYSTHGIMLSYHIKSEKKAPDVEEEEEDVDDYPSSDTLAITEEKEEEEEEKTPSPKEQKEDVSIVGPTDRKQIWFKVQIGVSSQHKFLAPANFNGMENVEEYQEGGLFKYIVGLAYHYDYAKNILLKQVKRRGYPEAFLVAFYKGKIISVEEALELIKLFE